MKNKYGSSLIFILALFQLTGCFFESKSSSSGSGSSSLLSGVAATGAPVSKGKVEIKGSNGVIVEDTTNSDGSYEANISTLSEPYLVLVTAPSGEKLITVASRSALAEGKKINVTPLTHIIVANVFGNADADDLFSNFESESSNFSEQKLEDEKDELLQKFIDAGLVGVGKIANGDIDLLNGNLLAGTSIGVDGLLDVIQVNTDASAGIEIKLKGAVGNLFVDNVATPDAPVVAVSVGELAAAKSQLSVIELLRVRMNALAALHSSKVACNGAPVDNAGACGLDTLYAAFAPFFHPDYQQEGKSGDAGIWGWFCRIGDNEEEASTKAACLADGEIKFENVSLKDITLISFNDTTKVALINFNFYQDGVLHGSEEMFLKLDNADSKYKLLGDRKTFKYWIDTQSLFETNFDKSISTAGYQGTNSYKVNLNFYYNNQGSYTFDGDEVFTLTAASGHTIFPGDSASMSLYLVVGPTYDSGSSSCTPGLVFSTRPDPYKVYNSNDGSYSYSNYATACAYTNDPCDCRPTAVENAYLDHDVAQKISLSLAQIATMDKVEKINLTGSGVTADSFTIKKPLVVNEFNAAEFIPSFGMTVSNFCKALTYSSPLNLSVVSGNLNGINIYHNYSNAGGTTWNSTSDSENYDWDSNLSSATFTPSFSGITSSDVIRNSYLWLSSRDEFDRQFVRNVSCNGN